MWSTFLFRQHQGLGVNNKWTLSFVMSELSEAKLQTVNKRGLRPENDHLHTEFLETRLIL